MSRDEPAAQLAINSQCTKFDLQFLARSAAFGRARLAARRGRPTGSEHRWVTNIVREVLSFPEGIVELGLRAIDRSAFGSSIIGCKVELLSGDEQLGNERTMRTRLARLRDR